MSKFMKNKMSKIYINWTKMRYKVAFWYSLYIKFIQEIMKKDRDTIEKSKKAFISFIRSYSEHEVFFY